MTRPALFAGLLFVLPALDASAEPVVVQGITYGSFAEWSRSPAFRESGARCGTRVSQEARVMAGGDPGDCNLVSTNPDARYAPGNVYEIPVVVHIIMGAGGQGAISDALVSSQIAVLNEAYQALPGTPGAGGTNAAVRFKLATVDPEGKATSGITRTTNATWFSDGGTYWTSLAWDTNRYCNIYTNEPVVGGQPVLGYTFLPQSAGIVGNPMDRIVIHWAAFGRPALGDWPYDQGQTCTHEMGHYLGLYHTFQDNAGVVGDSGCGPSAPEDCWGTCDLICDTNPEQVPVFGCPGSSESCGAPSPDPFHNYMDYTDDECMTNFTSEQVRRMRCSLEHYRPGLYETFTPVAPTSWGRLKGAWRGSR